MQRQKRMDDTRKRKREGKQDVVVCFFVLSAAFAAAVQGVVCHARLLNLSLAWQLFVCVRKVRGILSFEQEFTISFTTEVCQGRPADMRKPAHI